RRILLSFHRLPGIRWRYGNTRSAGITFAQTRGDINVLDGRLRLTGPGKAFRRAVMVSCTQSIGLRGELRIPNAANPGGRIQYGVRRVQVAQRRSGAFGYLWMAGCGALVEHGR